MDQPLAVRGVQRLADVAHHLHPLDARHRLRGLAQRLAVDELERDERVAVELADAVDLADVRMLDARLGPRLLHQPARQVGAGVAHDLQRDVAPEAWVEGLVDLAHAAATEQSEHLIALGGDIGAGVRRTTIDRLGLVERFEHRPSAQLMGHSPLILSDSAAARQAREGTPF